MALFAPVRSSPPSVALRPRFAAHSPMSGALLQRTEADGCRREMFKRRRAQVPPPGVALWNVGGNIGGCRVNASVV